jgi:CHAT domain-containing protein
LYAGASSVLVSLWNVYDTSTAEFMSNFYNAMERKQLNKAAALRQARTEMIRSRKFSHPYYWAPFVLMGSR